ncbi:transposase [Peptostreptococcus porci]|uniref:transposase n=1 Tax=Peptostreptococcus porci TaxID=2652282 RepID=UPI002ED621B7
MIDLVSDRRKFNLKEYFSSYPLKVREKVRYITTDIYAPYIDIAREMFPNAKIVLDKGDIFRTIIPLKKIATQKVGGENVPHDVPHGRNELIEYIKAQVRSNNKITRQDMAESAGVSVKTIQRALKEIDNLNYVGSGNNGHWELNEKK